MAAKKNPKKPKKPNLNNSVRFYPELKPEQEAVIMLIVHSGMSIKDSAAKVNRSIMAVYEWMKDPIMRKCLETEKERLHMELMDKFSSLPEKAYNAIQMNLMSDTPDVKVALQFLEKSGNLVKTTEKSNADEKTRRMAQALVAELSSIAED